MQTTGLISRSSSGSRDADRLLFRPVSFCVLALKPKITNRSLKSSLSPFAVDLLAALAIMNHG